MQDQSSTSKLDEYLAKLLQNDSRCTTIDLSNCHIGEEGVKKLAHALTNTTAAISELNLSGNHLGPESIRWFRPILERSPRLTSLNISDNQTTNQVVQLIALALETNRTLVELNLSHNHLSANSGEVLAQLLQYNHTLRILNLSHNKLGDAGAVALATALYKNNTTLEKLALSENGIGTQGVSAFANTIMMNRSLSHLDFSQNDIWDEDADALVEAFKSKAEFSVKEKYEEEGEKNEAQEVTTYFHLNLRGNWISTEQAKQLAEAAADNKDDVDVAHQYTVVDKTIKPSATLPNEPTVFVGDLKKGLAEKQKVDLSHCNLDDQKIEALIEELRKNTNLTALYISHNKISAKGISNLLAAIPNKAQLVHLDISHNRIGAEEVKPLTELLTTDSKLQYLFLAGNQLGDKGVKHLAESLHNNTTLTCLNLSKNAMTGISAEALERMLYRKNALCILDVSNNHLNNRGAAALGRITKCKATLRVINLANNSVSDIGMLADAIEFFPAPRDLNLSGNPIKIDSFERLKHSYCGRTYIWRAGDQIVDISLHLSNCQIRWKEASEIADIICSTSYHYLLKLLDLSHNDLGFKGHEVIAAAFLKNGLSVTHLNLSNTGLDDRAVELLTKSLGVVRTYTCEDLTKKTRLQNYMRELDLSQNKVGHRGILALQALIQHHCRYSGDLYYIDLSDNEIDDQSVYALTDIVNLHAGKTPLAPRKFGINLQRNKMTDETIAQLLKKVRSKPNYKLLLGSQQLVTENIYQADDQSSLSSSYTATNAPVSSSEKSKELPGAFPASSASSSTATTVSSPQIITDSAQEFVSQLTLASQQQARVSSKRPGPRQITGWELQDVPAHGNCFYEAVVHQFHQIHHAFLNTVPAGTAPRDSLRLRIQGTEFNDGEWADEEQIILLALQFNVVVAVVDTRYPANHFRYLYFDENRDYKYANNPALLPKGKSIIQLAFTGNHYLSVIHALPRPDLHQRINMLRQADVQKTDVPHKVDIPKESDSHKSELQEKRESLQKRMERLRQEREQKEKKAADSYSVINFSDSDIGDQDAERLAMQFRNNKACTYLDLSNTGMNNKGFEKLVGTMCQNGVLAELYFEDNRISLEGIRFFSAILAKNETLKIISLSGNALGDEGVRILADALSYNTTLERLMLSGNDLTSNGIKYLVKAIFDKKNLMALDLSSNKIGYEGMSTLTRLVHQGIITHLDISHSGVWSQDVKGLTETLKTNTTLQFLDLSGNKIENDAARLLAMAVREAGNAALIKGGLYFGKPQVTTKDDKGEEDGTSVPKKEDDGATPPPTEELTILLERARRASLPCLVEPDPSCITELQKQLKALKENKSSSTFLNFSNDPIGDIGVQRLAETLHDKETLQSLALGLSKCQITDAGIVTLATRLDANPHIHLIFLDLSNNAIGADGAMGLTLVMSQRTLVHLNLSRNYLGPHGIRRLMMGFQGDQTLRYLDLSRNILRDEVAIELAQVLRIMNALRTLKISGNQIGNKGAAALATALELSKTLTELDLSDNELNHEGMKALADAFFKHTAHLENLNLARNDIGVKGAKVLRDELCTNHCLWYLNIDKNNIGDKGASYIADLIEHNTALRQLTLKNNRIGAKSLTDLTDALGRNKKTRLAEMGIEGNKTFLPVFWKVMTPILRNNHFLHVIENLREVPARKGSHLELPNDVINKIFSYDEKMASIADKKDRDQMLREVWKRLTDKELEKKLQKITKKTLWGTLKQGFFSSSNRRGPSGGQPQPAPHSRLSTAKGSFEY